MRFSVRPHYYSLELEQLCNECGRNSQKAVRFRRLGCGDASSTSSPQHEPQLRCAAVCRQRRQARRRADGESPADELPFRPRKRPAQPRPTSPPSTAAGCQEARGDGLGERPGDHGCLRHAVRVGDRGYPAAVSWPFPRRRPGTSACLWRPCSRGGRGGEVVHDHLRELRPRQGQAAPTAEGCGHRGVERVPGVLLRGEDRAGDLRRRVRENSGPGVPPGRPGTGSDARWCGSARLVAPA